VRGPLGDGHAPARPHTGTRSADPATLTAAIDWFFAVQPEPFAALSDRIDGGAAVFGACNDAISGGFTA
jgi:hypothetical protein